ncbi:hypothetical protein AAC387_Pa11g1868 [Persea americana]
MEEDKVPARASSSFAPSAAPPPPPLPPSSSTAPASAPAGIRQRFKVELRPGETTIVSWKKLLKESNRAAPPSSAPEPPSGAHPALESRIAPPPSQPGQAAECELEDGVPPPNRFSAVIEKIERLYMGQQSSDEEELDDVPDDDEYDTEDSFIDDAELDEYFQVDKLATKHNGFFVNRGKLEKVNEPVSSPNHAPKKRRRKDVSKTQSEMDGENLPNKHVKVGNVRMKAAARNAAVVGNKSLSPPKIPAPLHQHSQTGKSLQDKLNAPTGPSKKKFVDANMKSSVKLQGKEGSFLPKEAKDIDKQKTGAVHSKDHVNKKATSASSDVISQSYHDKVVSSFQADHQCRKPSIDTNERETSTKVRHREKNGSELFDLNSSGGKCAMQIEKSTSTASKEGSSIRPKGTMLERAIRDLEKIVAESRPPTLEIQETDPSFQGVKRRLPREVKQKLAKVARLAQSSQGRISEELVNRLMSILGHLVQLKTLKRNLKEMVELGLSAKQQKDDRLQQIKKEVIEMIKMRAPFSKFKVAEQQDGSCDDFQEQPNSDEKGVLKGRYSMDNAMEDKICDLYDLYVEGMDEDKGPQIRKLYVELAELWPNGSMDNNGIKSAVNKAKERRSLYLRYKEKVKRRKISPPVKTEEIARGDGSLNTQPRAVQEKLAVDSSSYACTSSDRPFPNLTTNHHHLATLGRMSNPPVIALGIDQLKHEKIKRSMIVDETGRATDAAILKKKIKRKPEYNVGDIHVHQAKLALPSQNPGKERQKSQKPATSPHRSNLQSAVLPGFEQPS